VLGREDFPPCPTHLSTRCQRTSLSVVVIKSLWSGVCRRIIVYDHVSIRHDARDSRGRRLEVTLKDPWFVHNPDRLPVLSWVTSRKQSGGDPRNGTNVLHVTNLHNSKVYMYHCECVCPSLVLVLFRFCQNRFVLNSSNSRDLRHKYKGISEDIPQGQGRHHHKMLNQLTFFNIQKLFTTIRSNVSQIQMIRCHECVKKLTFRLSFKRNCSKSKWHVRVIR
jgi:hypothetical protein